MVKDQKRNKGGVKTHHRRKYILLPFFLNTNLLLSTIEILHLAQGTQLLFKVKHFCIIWGCNVIKFLGEDWKVRSNRSGEGIFRRWRASVQANSHGSDVGALGASPELNKMLEGTGALYYSLKLEQIQRKGS